jgi:hypothetical protein
VFAAAGVGVQADTTVTAAQAGTILEAFKSVLLVTEVRQGARRAVKN